MKPGDHVMYMGHCAIVMYVYNTTASIRFIEPVRYGSRQIDVFLGDIVIAPSGHICKTSR